MAKKIADIVKEALRDKGKPVRRQRSSKKKTVRQAEASRLRYPQDYAGNDRG